MPASRPSSPPSRSRATSGRRCGCRTRASATRPGVIWRAYLRWGMAQGIPGIRPDGEVNAAFAGTPDGWLHTVPAMGQRRGSSPIDGDHPAEGHARARRNGPSPRAWAARDWSASCRLAVMAFGRSNDQAVDLARRATALTHGSGLGLDVTTAGRDHRGRVPQGR